MWQPLIGYIQFILTYACTASEVLFICNCSTVYATVFLMGDLLKSGKRFVCMMCIVYVTHACNTDDYHNIILVIL